MSMISIIIPAYNEEKRIGICLEKFTSYFSGKKYNYEIIVSEDGSTDRTYEIAKSMSKKNKRIKVFHSSKRLGKGGGIIKGLKKAKGAIISFADVDLSAGPRELDKLIVAVNSGTDLAMGARRLKKAKVRNETFSRKIASKGYNILVNTLFDFGIKDTQCGLKALSREALDKILPKLTQKGFVFDVELILRAKQLGLAIEEIPITWRYKGETKISLSKDSSKMFFTTTKLWFKETFNRFDVLFILLLLSFFAVSLFFIGSTPTADEGTHNLIGLFFHDFINHFSSNPTFSFSQIYQYVISYLTYYPKVSLYYPPVFHIFLSFMYRFFGISLFTGSLAILLFSIATLAFIFKFSKNRLEDREVGIISSILFILCPMIFYLSIKTMIDIPLFFFFLASIYFYLLALKTNRSKYFIIASIFSTLGVLTKWNVLLVFPIVLLYSLLNYKRSIKKLLLSFFLIILLLSPYLYLAYNAGFLFLPLETSLITAGYKEKDPQYTSLEGWFYYPRALSDNYFTFPIFILSLFSLAYYSIKKQKHWKLFLIWFLVLYLFFTWLPNKDPRYILPIWPSLIFPLATYFKSLKAKLKFVALLLICILLLNASYFYIEPILEYKTDFDSVIDNVTEKDGNVLLASETTWFYSSSFMFELASKEGRFVRKVFRPCVLEDTELKTLLDEYGIRYVLITNPIRELHQQNIQKISELPQLHHISDVENEKNKISIYENVNYTFSDSKCNYICILKEWVCQGSELKIL